MTINIINEPNSKDDSIIYKKKFYIHDNFDINNCFEITNEEMSKYL